MLFWGHVVYIDEPILMNFKMDGRAHNAILKAVFTICSTKHVAQSTVHQPRHAFLITLELFEC